MQSLRFPNEVNICASLASEFNISNIADVHDDVGLDPCGPSQKIECVFTASPETIRREPREFDLRRSVGNRRTWQSARCVILLFFPGGPRGF